MEEAKDVLRRHFADARGHSRRRRPFTSTAYRALRGGFFEWVAGYALKELVDEGLPTVFDKNNVDGLDRHEVTKRMRFYASSAALRSGKDMDGMKRRVLSTATDVERYSRPRHTSVVGKHLRP